MTHVYKRDNETSDYIRRFAVPSRRAVRSAKCAVRDALGGSRESLWSFSHDPDLAIRKSLEAERLVFKSLYAGPDMLDALKMKKHE